MIPTINYPHPKPTHQTHHPNPPPKQKIINSKDQAIQQLIYENTILKKQLSQLLLKITPTHQIHNLNSIETVTTSVRPSVSHLGSCRNSLSNSMDFSSSEFHTNGHNFTDKVCEEKSQPQQKMILQRQNKRANRHSVDNLCLGYQNQFYQPINQNQHIRGLVYRNQNQVKNSTPLAINQREVKFQTHQNFANTQSYSFKQQNTCITEQEMYRQKMSKLKGRRNSQSKRLSEEKHVSKPVCQVTPVALINQDIPKASQSTKQTQGIQKIKNSESYQTTKQTIQNANTQSNLTKVHEVLKSKLNSPQFSPTLKSRANQSRKYKQIISQTCQNSLPLSHQRIPSQEKKMIPKYTPKNFSQQKENKVDVEQKKVVIHCVNQDDSVKANQRKQTESSSKQVSRQEPKLQMQVQNEPKKVCLRELRGRVYLDDQGQGVRTKRALSKNTINTTCHKNSNSVIQAQNQCQEQATKRKNFSQVEQLRSKRINTAESQLTYVDVDILKKVSIGEKGFSCTEKVMVKKNSNRVYLEEDEGEKHNYFRNKTQNSKQVRTVKDKQYAQAQQVKEVKFQGKLQSDKVEELVSIEEIHMISDKSEVLQSSTKQVAQTCKRTPPLSRQNSIQNQLSRNKNLYNQVYCEESKKDLHS